MSLKERLKSAMNQFNSKLWTTNQKEKKIYLKDFQHITITKMNRGDLIFIATVDSFKNSRSISGVGSGFLQESQLDNFASVKLDPTPLSEQNQTIHKIMVNWSGSDILAKPLLPPRLYGMVWNFWRMYFKRWIPNDAMCVFTRSNPQSWIYKSCINFTLITYNPKHLW